MDLPGGCGGFHLVDQRVDGMGPLCTHALAERALFPARALRDLFKGSFLTRKVISNHKRALLDRRHSQMDNVVNVADMVASLPFSLSSKFVVLIQRYKLSIMGLKEFRNVH